MPTQCPIEEGVRPLERRRCTSIRKPVFIPTVRIRSEGMMQSQGLRLFVHWNIIKSSKPVKTARNREAIMHLLIGLHCKKDITCPHLPSGDALRCKRYPYPSLYKGCDRQKRPVLPFSNFHPEEILAPRRFLFLWT